jgi:hypothetical protein
MLLALVTLAAAMELRVVVRAPDGTEGTVTALMSGETILTRYPLPIGKKFTALVSATQRESLCTVDVEIFRGDMRRGKRVMAPRLILTEHETSFLETTKTEDGAGRKNRPDWQVEAAIREDFALPPELAAPGAPAPTPATPAPSAPAPAAPTEPAPAAPSPAPTPGG